MIEAGVSTIELSGYGFAIVLDKDTEDRLIRFQHSVCGVGQFQPRLGTDKNQPHITLYQGSFDPGLQVDAVLQRACEFLTANRNSLLTLLNIVYKPDSWYFLLVQRAAWLSELQQIFMKEIRHHIRARSNVTKSLSGYTPSEIESFSEYGYRYVGSAFLPHVTLGRAPSPLPSSTLEKLNHSWASLGLDSGSVAALTFYKMGVNGSHESSVRKISIP